MSAADNLLTISFFISSLVFAWTQSGILFTAGVFQD